jgi:hypothetical protein
MANVPIAEPEIWLRPFSIRSNLGLALYKVFVFNDRFLSWERARDQALFHLPFWHLRSRSRPFPPPSSHNMNELPLEVVERVTNYLEIRSYQRMRSTNKSFRQLRSVPRMWLPALKQSLKIYKKWLQKQPDNEEEFHDPSHKMNLVTCSVDMNAWSFLVRYGMRSEFERLFDRYGRGLDSDAKEILMGLATGT